MQDGSQASRFPYPRVNQANRRTRGYVEPRGWRRGGCATPWDGLSLQDSRGSPWQFLGRGGGPRICRISREISRRRDSQDTHITRKVDVVTSRARGNYPAELHAKLSPHGQPDDLKGVGLSGAADTLLTTLNYLADACACTSPAQSRQDRGSSSYDRNRQE